MGFKDNLKKYRMQAGFKSAKQLADALEIPYTTYMGYENKNNWPPLETLLKIAYTLGVDVNTLVGYIPPTEKTPEEILKCVGILVSHTGDKVTLYYDSKDKTKYIDLPESLFTVALKDGEAKHKQRIEILYRDIDTNLLDAYIVTLCDSLRSRLDYAISSGNKEKINLEHEGAFSSFLSEEKEKRSTGSFAIVSKLIGIKDIDKGLLY